MTSCGTSRTSHQKRIWISTRSRRRISEKPGTAGYPPTLLIHGTVDTDGYTDEPVHLKAKVTISPGNVHFDFTGSEWGVRAQQAVW